MSTPCAACKHLRKKCTQNCTFAPYFPADKYDKYKAVHEVFGASHVARLLNEIPPSRREEAMNSLCIEADARLRDPIYGCTSLVYPLQRQLQDLQTRLAIEKNELASYNIIPYQQNRSMMMHTYADHLTAQQLHEEAQQSEKEFLRFVYTHTAQMQQIPETRTQHK